MAESQRSQPLEALPVLDLEEFYRNANPDPQAMFVKVAMALNLLTRESRIAYSARANPRWLYGANSQGTYALALNKLAGAAELRAAGHPQPTDNPWNMLLAKRENIQGKVTDKNTADGLARIANLQRRFALDPGVLAQDDISALMYFNYHLRGLTEEAVVETLYVPYLSSDIPPPDSMIDPLAFFEFSDIEYWRRSSSHFSDRQRAHFAGSIAAMQMISMHRQLQAQQDT